MISRRTTFALLIVAGYLFLAGCHHTESSPVSTARCPTVATESNARIAEPEDTGPSRETSGNYVIGHLKTRDKIITIRTGRDGPLYTVKTKEGNILAVGLMTSEISSKFPELEELVKHGLAEPDAWAGSEQMKFEHNKALHGD